MGAKGTNLPPDGVKKYLNQAGKGPNEWPPKAWGTEQNGTTKTCEPTNPSNLAEEHVVGGYPPIGGTKIDTKLPLSYLYKPATQSLVSDGGGGLMNRFTLPNAECIGANKVLAFVTGAAGAPGDIPSGLLDCTEDFGNRIYAEFDSAKEQYCTTWPNGSYAKMGFDDGAVGGYTDDYTVSAWIKPKALTTWPLQYIMSMTSASLDAWSTPPWGLLNYGPWNTFLSGAYFHTMVVTPGSFTPAYKRYSTQAALLIDTWYHTAFTWHSASQALTLYIDGISQSVDKISDDPITTNYPKNGGNIFVSRKPTAISPETAVMGFSGSIDEVSMWNTNLNDAEVFEIFSSSQYCSDGPGNLNMHSKKDNLISWWRMGENVLGWQSSKYFPGGTNAFIDIAFGASAAQWYPSQAWCLSLPPTSKCFGTTLYFPTESLQKPTYQSEDFLSGASVSVGIYVGYPPWVAISGTFPNGNQNLIMLPGARVELTWQPFPLTKPGYPPHPDQHWTTNIMHSGCYSCGGVGPKAYLTGAIDHDVLAWPPP